MQLKGIFAILLTPLAEDERLDEPAYRRLVRRLTGAGVDGLVVLGSNSEGPLLTHAVRDRAIAAAVEEAQGLPVIAGTSEAGTRLAVQSTRRARELGAGAALLMPPYYLPCSQAAAIRHYETVAGEADLPILLYNYPALSKVKLEVETVVHLSRHPRIVGMKDSMGDWAYHEQVLARTAREKFFVFQSWEDYVPIAAYRGADGIMSPAPCICPEWCVGQWRAWKAGNAQAAGEYFRKVMAVIAQVNAHPMPAGWKAALRLLGYGNGKPAEPLQPLEGEELALMGQALAELGLM